MSAAARQLATVRRFISSSARAVETAGTAGALDAFRGTHLPRNTQPLEQLKSPVRSQTGAAGGGANMDSSGKTSARTTSAAITNTYAMHKRWNVPSLILSQQAHRCK
eukprot:5304865-Prymnesium_polylepis.1